jgi:hypothetical protein
MFVTPKMAQTSLLWSYKHGADTQTWRRQSLFGVINMAQTLKHGADKPPLVLQTWRRQASCECYKHGADKPPLSVTNMAQTLKDGADKPPLSVCAIFGVTNMAQTSLLWCYKHGADKPPLSVCNTKGSEYRRDMVGHEADFSAFTGKKKLIGLSPQANYTDRATAACQ